MSLLEAQRNQPSIYCHTPTPEETPPPGEGVGPVHSREVPLPLIEIILRLYSVEPKETKQSAQNQQQNVGNASTALIN